MTFDIYISCHFPSSRSSKVIPLSAMQNIPNYVCVKLEWILCSSCDWCKVPYKDSNSGSGFFNQVKHIQIWGWGWTTSINAYRDFDPERCRSNCINIYSRELCIFETLWLWFVFSGCLKGPILVILPQEKVGFLRNLPLKGCVLGILLKRTKGTSPWAHHFIYFLESAPPPPPPGQDLSFISGGT